MDQFMVSALTRALHPLIAVRVRFFGRYSTLPMGMKTSSAIFTYFSKSVVLASRAIWELTRIDDITNLAVTGVRSVLWVDPAVWHSRVDTNVKPGRARCLNVPTR